MSESTSCAQCGAPLADRGAGPGRRRRFCSPTCRQAAHRARTTPPLPRCQMRVGTAMCPQPAVGRLFGASIPGARLQLTALVAEMCDDCRPAAVAWLTAAAGVQPVWARFDAAD